MTTADAAPSRFRHLRSAFSMSGTMLTALLALVSGGLALFFQLRPDLQPDPRTHLGATADVFAVDGDISLKTFLARRAAIVSPAELRSERAAYLASAGGSPALLTLPGEDVYVELTVEGFKSRSIALLASMYDARTKRRLRVLDDVPVFSERLSSPSARSVVEFWLPAPPVTTSRYFVRIAVYHRGDGVLLAIADSPPVRATG
ncbi:MAG TPA: hypothetical protein VI408_03945 [Gaiellaceae bacterium]